ncbi:ABC transporter ATP-binding protein [Puniceibacterium sp. IMCC21224]|uniref:ABC transporter ATP-binding protein n=1 Tax=Puniceibacterium sp. IMCC21224 TaxID=1618204 RepID=UPI00064DCA56|nr:ABC transporter ATP-binding protein [Puniceibacterium sp. IMCC21224]KMK65317.1 ABC-type branched-chain amino acid transport system, ATPase component [Puniceibacterium sp. IMCC21224]
MNVAAKSLKGDAISLSFGGIKVLQDLDVEFRAGEITGLIGPNGAGKTSLFNCLTGAYSPQKGSITYAGHALNGLSPAARATRGIVRSFQHVALSPDLTVLENVMVGVARNYHAGWVHAFFPTPRAHKERTAMRGSAQAALQELGLAGVADKFPAELPPGMLRLVEIARAIVGKPDVLLLDEPAAGLNNSETRDLMRSLRNLAASDLVMVVVEHDMDLVMSICDRIYVLNFGEIVACGSPQQVRNNEDVVRIYLGSDDD